MLVLKKHNNPSVLQSFLPLQEFLASYLNMVTFLCKKKPVLMLCRCAVVNAKKKEKKRKHIGRVCTHVMGKTAEVVNKEPR